MAGKKKKPEDLTFKQISFWDSVSPKEHEQARVFCEDYKKFLNNAKTEIQVVKETIKQVKRSGFEEVDLDSNIFPHSNKLIFNNRNKSAIFVSIGKNGLDLGAKFMLAHTDSPRLDLKVRPLYEDSGIAYLKSHYYGGIRKYHWPTIPLSLIGTVVLAGGVEIEINLGEHKDDPVFLISDLLPHLVRKEADIPQVQGEELNILVGSCPIKDKKAKDRVKLAVLEWLNENYRMKEVDFFSADLRFVPSFTARDIGFDRSMIAGYGQDDRVCVYTSIQALLDSKDDNTKICYLADKEEIASDGSTGAKSLFLENVISYLIKQGESKISIYDFYRKSKCISADTTGAYDPDYKDKQDMSNAILIGNGMAIEKHNGVGGKYYSVDAEPKYIRRLIDLFDKKKIIWQTGKMGKIDLGGGGTLAVYLANRNVEVIDAGVPLLNLHSPYELASKADIYSAYKGYRVFLEN